MSVEQKMKELKAKIQAIERRHKKERLHTIDANERNDDQVMNDTKTDDRLLQANIGPPQCVVHRVAVAWMKNIFYFQVIGNGFKDWIS